MMDLPALTRLYELDEVSAAFVFRSDGKVLGYAAPSNYTEATIAQVALFLRMPINQVEKAKVNMKDFRVSFEAFSVWLKRFGGEYTLAVFIQSGANFGLLRQPINLSVLNLEKAILRQEHDGPESELAVALAAAAHQAEMEMLTVEGEDTNSVFERMCLLSEYFFGPVAPELLQHGLRAEEMSLPLSTRPDMDRLVQYMAKFISNVERKKMYLDEMGDLIDRLELEQEQGSPVRRAKGKAS